MNEERMMYADAMKKKDDAMKKKDDDMNEERMMYLAEFLRKNYYDPWIPEDRTNTAEGFGNTGEEEGVTIVLRPEEKVIDIIGIKDEIIIKDEPEEIIEPSENEDGDNIRNETMEVIETPPTKQAGNLINNSGEQTEKGSLLRQGIMFTSLNEYHEFMELPDEDKEEVIEKSEQKEMMKWKITMMKKRLMTG